MSLRVAMPMMSPLSSVTGLPVISLSVRKRASRSMVQWCGTALTVGVMISWARTLIGGLLPFAVLLMKLSRSLAVRHPCLCVLINPWSRLVSGDDRLKIAVFAPFKLVALILVFFGHGLQRLQGFHGDVDQQIIH